MVVLGRWWCAIRRSNSCPIWLAASVFQSMSLAFLVGTLFVVGALTVYGRATNRDHCGS